MEPLLQARDALWTWAAAPVLALAAILLTAVLRAPQILRLPEAFRAALEHDPKASGTLPPPTALVLSAAASWGSAAAVSAATAVALGGAGAIAWLWLFGLLLAPLRFGEALLARTAPPGRAGADARGSLATRLAADGSPAIRALGAALVVLVPLASFAWIGGAHGGAAMDAAARLLPGNEIAVGIVVAVVAALLAAVALGKAGPQAIPIVGWLALAALAAVLAVSIVGLLHDAGRVLGTFSRAIEDAFGGAEPVGSFSGALAGEIAGAALVHVLPPIAAPTGVDGAIEDAARAPVTRRQASAALLGPLFHVVLTTLLAASFVSTGAFHRRVEDERRLSELTFWRSGFDTVSQRRETDRRFDGTIRVAEGVVLARPLELATERGMITSPTYTQHGEPGDFAIVVDSGVPERLLEPDEEGTLAQVPLSHLAEVEVQGRMLPRGARLVEATMDRAGGDVASRIALVAILLLAAIGAAAWGLAASRAVPRAFALGVAFLPALGLALAASGVAPWLAPVGSIVAGVLAIVAAIGIAAKVREIATLAK